MCFLVLHVWCCFYRLHAFKLCFVLCGTQLVFFIDCVLSCCHVLCEHVAYEYSHLLRVRVLFCTWLVIYILLAMCLCFVLCEHMAFVLVFCVPCAQLSKDNSHCPIFFTKSMDALAHEWPSLLLYAFPPIALLPQVLMRVREQRHKIILIAPLWRNQPWLSE